MDATIERLKDGLEKIKLSVDENKIFLLSEYYKLIIEWNKKINLVSRQEEDIVGKHILDCLSIRHLLRGRYLLDFGSGAGLPGIPLKIIYDDLQLDLVEVREKRTTFLKTLKSELRLKNVNVYNTDISQFHPMTHYDVITARKVGDIKKIVKLTSRLLNEEGVIITFKGERFRKEAEEARKILEKENLSIIKKERRIFTKGLIIVIGRKNGQGYLNRQSKGGSW